MIENLKNRVLARWDFMRILRMAIAIFIVIQGIATHDWTFSVLGSLLAFMPLLNIGCCCASACQLPADSNAKTTKDISYEEVH